MGAHIGKPLHPRTKWNILISPNNNVHSMYDSAKKFLDSFKPENKIFYGRGDASELIVKALLQQKINEKRK